MILDRWVELFQVLTRNRTRTLLTASGVFWGMWMLVVMLGFGNGLETGVKSSLGDSTTNAVFMWGRNTRMPYRGLKAGRRVRPNNAVVPVLQQVPGVKVLAPRNALGGYRGGESVRHGNEIGDYTVYGDVPDFRRVRAIELVEGRWLNERDLIEQRKIAVIGVPVRDELYGASEEVLGSTVTIKGVNFTVVGVFKTPFGGEQADRAERVLHLPLSTFQNSFEGYRDLVSWIGAVADDDVPGGVLEDRLRTELMASLGVHPEDRSAVGSYNSQEEFERIQKLFDAIRMLVWFVGLATLLSGVVGVSNVLLVTVRERTTEIGLRRALGATPGSVIWMILQEALVLTGVSGYAGLMVGLLVVEGVAWAVGEGSETFGPPSVSIPVVLTAFVALTLGGTLAGLLPARHAASIHPAAALRS